MINSNALKKSLLSLLAITLLLSNCHAFSMGHSKREEVITITPPQAQAERTQVEQELVLEDIGDTVEPESPITDMEDLPKPTPRETQHRERKKKKSFSEKLLSVFRKICGYSKPVGDDPVGAQHQVGIETNRTHLPVERSETEIYPRGIHLLTLPPEILEIVFSFLSDDFEDILHIMANNSQLYVAGLHYLLRSNTPIHIKISERTVANVGQDTFKKLKIAKREIEKILKKKYFTDKGITEKLQKKIYFGHIDFNQLVASVNENIRKHAVFFLVKKETKQTTQKSENKLKTELSEITRECKAIKKYSRNTLILSAFLMSGATALISLASFFVAYCG